MTTVRDNPAIIAGRRAGREGIRHCPFDTAQTFMVRDWIVARAETATDGFAGPFTYGVPLVPRGPTVPEAEERPRWWGKPKRPPNRPYTDEDNAIIISMRDLGRSAAEIGDKIGRTAAQVNYQASQLGLVQSRSAAARQSAHRRWQDRRAEASPPTAAE